MKSSNPLARFARADGPTKQRIIGLSFGEAGSRKTSFWLEAPAPIVVFSFDKGLEGVVQRYQDDKEIRVAEYLWSPDPDEQKLTQEQAVELRDQFAADFEVAVQHARTVVIDKENDLWELYRYAEFGEPNDNPKNYASLNQRYRRIINMAKALDINFGCIDGMKDEWVPRVNKKTGAQGVAKGTGRIRVGFGELDGLVHMVLLHSGVSPDTWQIEVGKVRGPGILDVAGQTFLNLSFPEMAMLVFPDSSPEDWGA